MENKNNATTELLSLASLLFVSFILFNFWNWFMVPLSKALSIDSFHLLGFILAAIAITSIFPSEESKANFKIAINKTEKEKKESIIFDLLHMSVIFVIGFVAHTLLM